MIRGIAIAGANGSGKTTLGRMLADMSGFRHMDAEDYYFKESVIPYASSRTKEEVKELMAADIKKYGQFILTSVNPDYGPEINALYDYVIYIKAPLEVRMQRVKQRSLDKFGSRVLEGGDMYGQEQKFFEYVASRTMDQTDTWLKSVTCPVLFVDGREAPVSNVRMIMEKLGL